MMRRVSGRGLSRQVVGDNRDTASLTDFFRLGRERAGRVLDHMPSRGLVLEFGGNVGQVGCSIAPHVQRLVSVDADPAMKVYGQYLSPHVEFLDLDELPDDEVFDGAYCIGAWASMTPGEQRAALEYVDRHLAPGAGFVVDLGPRGDTPMDNGDRKMPGASIDDFTSLVDPLFAWRRVPLIDVGFVLTKPSSDGAGAGAPTDRVRVNDESVVADLLDGEVVVVNLESGAYYVLQGSAATMWLMFVGGMTAGEVVDELVGLAGDDADLIESWVDDFRQQLLDEQLVVSATSDVVVTPPPDAMPATPIEPPVMFRYTDMQFLIQMDPIRDYDESGWPVRRAAQVIRPTE